MEVRTHYTHRQGKEPLDFYEDILDRLEFAEIEESPFGVTLLGITKEDIDVLKAVFGRNNGFKVPYKEELRPIIVELDTVNFGEEKQEPLRMGWYRVAGGTILKFLGLKRD